MSQLAIAVIVVSSILGYCIGIGVTWALLPEDWKHPFPYGKDRAGFCAAVWPIGLPILGGTWIVERIRDWADERADRRAEQRAAAKLPKAEVRRG